MNLDAPAMPRELERINALAAYNLDYETLQERFSDLTMLASQFAGTSISLINLLDADNQWSVARQGTNLPHMDKDQSVCQYTIKSDKDFEIANMRIDDRFREQTYIKNTALSYYYGVPLKTREGLAIGALCVLDDENPDLGKKQKGMLQLLAGEVMSRLDDLKRNAALENSIQLMQVERRMLAHDIRRPLGGIKGLAEVAAEEGADASKKDLLHYLELIKDSSNSVLELADEILLNERKKNHCPRPTDKPICCNSKRSLSNYLPPELRIKI